MTKSQVKKVKSNNRPKEYTTNRAWDLIASDLKQWALLPDSFILEEFYTNQDIPEQTFIDNCKKNKVLEEAHIFALIRLGINREKLAIKRGENINTTNSFVLPHYLKRFKEQIEWRNDLKKIISDAINSGIKIIEIEKYPNLVD